MRYIWEHPDWPHFQYDTTQIQEILYQYAMEAGSLGMGASQLPDDLQLAEFNC